MAKATKLTMPGDDLWIIRAERIKPDGVTQTYYYETPSVWNTCPVVATIFTTYEAAAAHLAMYAHRDKAKKGWADGSTETMDVVPLMSEIEHSPNRRNIEVKRDG